MSTRLIDTLLPPALIQHIQAATFLPLEQNERMVAVATLIVTLAMDTIIKIHKSRIKDLDANPGDRGCQLRAVLLSQLLSQPAVKQELNLLENRLKTVKQHLQVRQSKKN